MRADSWHQRIYLRCEFRRQESVFRYPDRKGVPQMRPPNHAAANPAGTSRLQAVRPVRRVAELLSLIWLERVKQTIALLSENFHFIRLCVTAAFLIQKQEHFTGVQC